MSRGRNRSSGNRRRRSPPAQSHRFAEAIEQSPARSRAAIFSSVWRAQSTRERPLRQALVSAVSREPRGYRRRISREYEPPGPRVSAGAKSGTLCLKSFGDSPPPRGAIAQYTSVTYSVPSTERLLNAKHFSRLPPKSVARQEALWQDTLREGSVRALCSPRPQFYRPRKPSGPKFSIRCCV